MMTPLSLSVGVRCVSKQSMFTDVARQLFKDLTLCSSSCHMASAHSWTTVCHRRVSNWWSNDGLHGECVLFSHREDGCSRTNTTQEHLRKRCPIFSPPWGHEHVASISPESSGPHSHQSSNSLCRKICDLLRDRYNQSDFPWSLQQAWRSFCSKHGPEGAKWMVQEVIHGNHLKTSNDFQNKTNVSKPDGIYLDYNNKPTWRLIGRDVLCGNIWMDSWCL